MTRRDFELIADAIFEANLPVKERVKITSTLAKKLEVVNTRFDESIFRGRAIWGDK